MDKKKILVVDDEEDILNVLKFRLEANGFDVVTASDGQEGLNKARSEKAGPYDIGSDAAKA